MMAVALHLLATLVVLPYLLLALAFLIAGQAIATGSIFGIVEMLAIYATWIIPWGAIAFVATIVAVVVLGVRASTRHWGAACVAALGIASLLVLVFLGGTVGAGEWLFLAPCIAASALAAHQALRWKPTTLSLRTTPIR
jgi:hypothetical protein